jgi:hypothetical protein
MGFLTVFGSRCLKRLLPKRQYEPKAGYINYKEGSEDESKERVIVGTPEQYASQTHTDQQ